MRTRTRRRGVAAGGGRCGGAWRRVAARVARVAGD